MPQAGRPVDVNSRVLALAEGEGGGDEPLFVVDGDIDGAAVEEIPIEYLPPKIETQLAVTNGPAINGDPVPSGSRLKTQLPDDPVHSRVIASHRQNASSSARSAA